MRYFDGLLGAMRRSLFDKNFIKPIALSLSVAMIMVTTLGAVTLADESGEQNQTEIVVEHTEAVDAPIPANEETMVLEPASMETAETQVDIDSGDAETALGDANGADTEGAADVDVIPVVENTEAIINEDLELRIEVRPIDEAAIPEDVTVAATEIKVENVTTVKSEDEAEILYEAVLNDGPVVLDVSEDKDFGEEVVSETALANVSEKCGDTDPEIMAGVPIDISLNSNGSEIEPEGRVEVRIEIPAGMDEETVKVFHIEGDSAVDMNARVEDGFAVFDTDHFSIYYLTASTTTTAATVLTSSSAGTTLNGGTVYTINSNTNIYGASCSPALKVSATDAGKPAVIYLPYEKVLNVFGGAGDGTRGGGAGIELKSGNYLYVRGLGELIANGGKGGQTNTGKTQAGDGFVTWAKVLWAFSMSYNSGRGGNGMAGGGGAGAGIGTGGGTGGAGVDYTPGSGALKQGAKHTGANGANGNNGGNSEDCGNLYVLDLVALNAIGGFGGDIVSSSVRTASNDDDKGSGQSKNYFAGKGGEGGGGGTGGAAPGVGSGGAGGGGGAAGGAGGISINTGSFGNAASYPSGGGGTGGKGNTNGENGRGTQYHSGGAGGKGGKSGLSGTGGYVYVAKSVSFYSSMGGNGVDGQEATVSDGNYDLNSKYDITFVANKPAMASHDDCKVDNAFPGGKMSVSLGRPINYQITASLTGWDFMGFYNDAGVQIIDSEGLFIRDIAGYIDHHGNYIHNDNITLTARFEPRKVMFSLNDQYATTKCTDAVYLLYDNKWMDESAREVSGITVPQKSGYEFDGFYTETMGGGDKVIDSTGTICVDDSVRLTYSDTNKVLFANWKAMPYTASVIVSEIGVDGSRLPATGKSVKLYQGSIFKYELAEDSENPGRYIYFCSYADATEDRNAGVINGTYQVYVDDAITSRELVVDNPTDGIARLDIETYELNLITAKDGARAKIGSATLKKDSVTVGELVYDDTEQLYKGSIVKGDDLAVYEIYMDGKVLLSDGEPLTYTAQDNSDERCKSVEFFTVEYDLIYDEEWKNANITLTQDDKTCYTLDYRSSTGSGEVKNIYQAFVQGNKGADIDEYKLILDGADTGRIITTTTDGVKQASDIFYRVGVKVCLDDAPWTGASVSLYQNNKQQYVCTYNASDSEYEVKHVKETYTNGDPEAEAQFAVYVDGIDSGDNSGLVVSRSDRTGKKLDYYSISFVKPGQISGSIDPMSVVYTEYMKAYAQKNCQVSEPPTGPYISGRTFSGWYPTKEEAIECNEPNKYNFATPITEAITLYAGYLNPQVILNDYRRCADDGALQADGKNYRLPNLAITGFPGGDAQVIYSFKIEVVNASVKLLEEPGKYTFYKNIDNATGDGSIDVVINEKDTIENVQNYLRSKVIYKVKDVGQDQTLQITVRGNTAID